MAIEQDEVFLQEIFSRILSLLSYPSLPHPLNPPLLAGEGEFEKRGTDVPLKLPY
jgi:hypothetical protein